MKINASGKVRLIVYLVLLGLSLGVGAVRAFFDASGIAQAAWVTGLTSAIAYAAGFPALLAALNISKVEIPLTPTEDPGMGPGDPEDPAE